MKGGAAAPFGRPVFRHRYLYGHGRCREDGDRDVRAAPDRDRRTRVAHHLPLALSGRFKSIPGGTYVVTVVDRSRRDNFRLTGPRVSRRTGVRFRGTVVWRVSFRAGATYRYRSDRHPRRLRGRFSTR
ncbi:MAG: hypothetical protein M3R70_14180 [Actinomycetota bacterium]|nr:hypothetical protein [Actinomycetota bacterium]